MEMPIASISVLSAVREGRGLHEVDDESVDVLGSLCNDTHQESAVWHIARRPDRGGLA